MMLKNLKIPVVTISTVEDKDNKINKKDQNKGPNADDKEVVDNINYINDKNAYNRNNNVGKEEDVDKNGNDDYYSDGNDCNKKNKNSNDNDSNNNNGEESHSSLHVRPITRKHSSYRYVLK